MVRVRDMGLVSRFLLRLLGLGLKLLWLGLGDRVRVGVSAKYGRQLCAVWGRCAGRGCNCPTFNISQA